MSKTIASALFASMVLAGCTPYSDAPSTSAAPAAQTQQPSVIFGPTTLPTPEEFQALSVVDGRAYKPQAIFPACNQRSLPRATPSADFLPALSAAKAYSDEQQGYGLIVLKDGAVVHESYGEGLDENLLTASASMHKSVMALSVGIAIEKGMIGSVDDPLSAYLPEWADDPRGAITVKNALQMASGLSLSNLMELLFADNSFAAAAQTELADEPGTVFNYTNAVSQLVNEAVHRQAIAAGYGGYPDFLMKELWCPLGGGEAVMWVDPSGRARGYAGFHASIRDYAKVGELIRHKGRVGDRQVVPEAWITQMTTPSEVNPQYGYQIWLGGAWTAQRGYSANNPIKVPHSAPFIAKDLVYFDGFGGQRVYVAPSHGVTVVRVGETNLAFDDAIIPNLLIEALEN